MEHRLCAGATFSSFLQLLGSTSNVAHTQESTRSGRARFVVNSRRAPSTSVAPLASCRAKGERRMNRSVFSIRLLLLLLLYIPYATNTESAQNAQTNLDRLLVHSSLAPSGVIRRKPSLMPCRRESVLFRRSLHRAPLGAHAALDRKKVRRFSSGLFPTVGGLSRLEEKTPLFGSFSWMLRRAQICRHVHVSRAKCLLYAIFATRMSRQFRRFPRIGSRGGANVVCFAPSTDATLNFLCHKPITSVTVLKSQFLHHF